MESQAAHDSPVVSRGFSAVRRAQGGLAAAALGAILVLFPFGRTLAIAGLFLIAAGTIVSTTFERKSHVWWGLLVAGALISLAAPLVAIDAETAGGFMAIIGGTLVLVSAVLALPARGEAP